MLAAAYVLSANLHRRQLNEVQRGVVAQRSMEYYERLAKERQKEHGNTAPGRAKNTSGQVASSVRRPQSRDEAGAAVGVSGRTVDRVRNALKTATPELVKAMERGDVTASQKGMVAARARDIYDAQARERKKAGLKKGTEKPVPESLPEREKGDARDKAGQAVGVSGKLGKNWVQLYPPGARRARMPQVASAGRTAQISTEALGCDPGRLYSVGFAGRWRNRVDRRGREVDNTIGGRIWLTIGA